MLTLLAPYIVGVLTQIGSIIGQAMADPAKGATTAEEKRVRTERFAQDLDTAQLIPSLVTIASLSIGISSDLGPTLTLITVIFAILTSAALPMWIKSKTPVEYADITRRLKKISPVNWLVIVVCVVLGLVVFLTKEPSTAGAETLRAFLDMQTR